MEFSALILFAAALFISAGTPGPSIAALVARVLARGAKDVMPFLIALWIGEGLWLAAAVFGLAVVAQSFQLAFMVIKYCGVLYLAYLAWKMWTGAGREHELRTPTQDSAVQLFLAGLAVTIGNPKIMVFYLALLPAIIDLTEIGAGGFAALAATMAAVLIGVDLAWVALAASARRLFRSPRALKIANRCGAAAMGGAAAAIATR